MEYARFGTFFLTHTLFLVNNFVWFFSPFTVHTCCAMINCEKNEQTKKSRKYFLLLNNDNQLLHFKGILTK